MKLENEVNECLNQLSHPAGVRGLKQLNVRKCPMQHNVAPRRGAWIET